MLNYFLKRLLGLTPTLLIVAVLVFLFVHMLPGDPARLAAGQDADQKTVELVRQELGLDRPLPEQFANFFTHMLKGDFGTSLRTRRPVSTEIAERFIREASHVLRPGGRFYLVANRFLKYEPTLRAHFKKVEEVAGNPRFKVLRALA